MSDDVVIRAAGVGKQYRIGTARQAYGTLRDSVTDWLRRAAGREAAARALEPTFWALKDVSFEVKRGEVLGVIGRNGAGKSTLLKVLSRITTPTEGRIEARGRVGTLLEVGAGFHPELTGRENIFMNGAILGMTRAEIRRKFDEIVAFAGVEQFLDTPVKRYSSGMYVRLAFAVPAFLEAEIMLVDEVLAVGDIGFRRKCLDKMHQVTEHGRTVLFVSHDMTPIRQLCDRAVQLDGGRIADQGGAAEVTARYEQAVLAELDELPPTRDRTPALPGWRLSKVELRNARGEPCAMFAAGETMEVHLWSNGRAPADNFTIEFLLLNSLGARASFGAANPVRDTYFSAKHTHFVCRLGPLPLTSGRYAFSFSARVWGGPRWDDWDHAVSFNVYRCDLFGTGHDVPGSVNGDFVMNQEWFGD